MHYGVPAGHSLHDDGLIDAFARFVGQVAHELAPLSAQPPVYTPVNEISFLAWAASMPYLTAEPNNTVPGGDEATRHRGYAVKRRLVRAALAAMPAIRQADPRARFLHVEPFVHVVPRPGAPTGRSARPRWRRGSGRRGICCPVRPSPNLAARRAGSTPSASTTTTSVSGNSTPGRCWTGPPATRAASRLQRCCNPPASAAPTGCTTSLARCGRRAATACRSMRCAFTRWSIGRTGTTPCAGTAAGSGTSTRQRCRAAPMRRRCTRCASGGRFCPHRRRQRLERGRGARSRSRTCAGISHATARANCWSGPAGVPPGRGWCSSKSRWAAVTPSASRSLRKAPALKSGYRTCPVPPAVSTPTATPGCCPCCAGNSARSTPQRRATRSHLWRG